MQRTGIKLGILGIKLHNFAINIFEQKLQAYFIKAIFLLLRQKFHKNNNFTYRYEFTTLFGRLGEIGIVTSVTLEFILRFCKFSTSAVFTAEQIIRCTQASFNLDTWYDFCYYISFHRYNSHCSFDFCSTRRYCDNLHAFVCGTKPGVRVCFSIQFYGYYSLYLRWQIGRNSFTYCYIYKKEHNSYQRISMQTISVIVKFIIYISKLSWLYKARTYGVRWYSVYALTGMTTVDSCSEAGKL